MKRSSKKGLLIFILWILTDIFAKYALDKAGFLDYFHVFDLVIVLIFELYMFFQLPGSEYFWDAVEHAEDPIHRKIRLAVMACIVAFLIFVFKWAYFLAFYFITTIRIDGIINFFRVSHEERHQILEKEGIPEIRSYLHILVVAPMIILILIAVGLFVFLWYIPAKSSGGKTQTVSFYQVEDSKPFQNKTLL